MGPSAGLSFLLGQFTLGDGRTAVMLQNQDDRVVAVPNVTIAPHLAQKHCCQVSPKDGQERVAIWGFPWGRIDPGGAALYVFSDAECGHGSARTPAKLDDDAAFGAASSPITSPRWTWATLQTYAHCSNQSGTAELPFDPAYAAYFGSLPFVVIEKTQGLASTPANRQEERKIAAAARQLVQANKSALVLAYYQTDKARTWYDSGVWFDEHPEYELRNSSGGLISCPPFHVYDYADPAAQRYWSRALANLTAADGVSGLFIDGPSDIDHWKQCSSSKREAWRAGLNASMHELRRLIGPTATIIGDGATNPLPARNGYMIQSWFRSGVILGAVSDLQTAPDAMAVGEINCARCKGAEQMGLALAVFLLGIKERQFFGNNAWSRCTESFAMRDVPELGWPLGEPETAAPRRTGNASLARKFASGTHVAVDWSAQQPKTTDGVKSCIWWANGKTTGNACGTLRGSAETRAKLDDDPRRRHSPARFSELAAPAVRPLLIHNESLLRLTWAKLRRDGTGPPPDLATALRAVEGHAIGHLHVPNFSVTSCPGLPPSGDQHDYVSAAVYWWPCAKTKGTGPCNVSECLHKPCNCTSADICGKTSPTCDATTGSPWVSCDGHENLKEIAQGGLPQLQGMSRAVAALAGGYYWTRNETFAVRAAQLIEAFFLAPSTYMNPNFEYGQAFPGVNNGSGSGLVEIDMALVDVLEAINLLSRPAPCTGCEASTAWTA